ncbi:MAG: CHAT domain-containing protein, partial [Leptospiraceae bacterium]|nr:CHAT domain-containing protein [Leptospiraceae bacterium]
ADPASNLPWARQEGEELYDRLLSHVSSERLVVQYLAGQRASKLRLLDEIRQSHIIHYAGHAWLDPHSITESGWVLHNGSILRAREILNTRARPLLVFSNSCRALQSNTQNQGLAAGLAQSFMQAGSASFIGTHWDIADNRSAVEFALRFYQAIFSEKKIGSALAHARHLTRYQSDQFDPAWANYVLYGCPDLQLYHSSMQGAYDSARLPGFADSLRNNAPLPIAKAYEFIGENGQAKSDTERVKSIYYLFAISLALVAAIVISNPDPVSEEKREQWQTQSAPDLASLLARCHDLLLDYQKRMSQIRFARVQYVIQNQFMQLKRLAQNLDEAMQHAQVFDAAALIVSSQFNLEAFIGDLFCQDSYQLSVFLPSEKRYFVLMGEKIRSFPMEYLAMLPGEIQQLFTKHPAEICIWEKESRFGYSLHPWLEWHAMEKRITFQPCHLLDQVLAEWNTRS